MESFIKKIFKNEKDNEVHIELIKFSRGVFNNRYLLEAKKQADKYSIKTGAEFANFFVRSCMEKIKGDVDVKGVIVATFDVSKEAGFEISNIKQFMGIKQAVVDTKVSSEKIISLMNKYPKAFFALTFSGRDFDLKIKPKAPKSAKPSTKDAAEIKIDFCSLKTNNMEIINDLFFDSPNFKEIRISHTIQIDQITLPKGEKDPVKIRENALRKGKIIRKIASDGKTMQKEVAFEA